MGNRDISVSDRLLEAVIEVGVIFSFATTTAIKAFKGVPLNLICSCLLNGYSFLSFNQVLYLGNNSPLFLGYSFY